jgi:hypothetical protein
MQDGQEQEEKRVKTKEDELYEIPEHLQIKGKAAGAFGQVRRRAVKRALKRAVKRAAKRVVKRVAKAVYPLLCVASRVSDSPGAPATYRCNLRPMC